MDSFNETGSGRAVLWEGKELSIKLTLKKMNELDKVARGRSRHAVRAHRSRVSDLKSKKERRNVGREEYDVWLSNIVKNSKLG